MADASDTMEAYVNWAHTNNEPVARHTQSQATQIAELFKTMSDQYIEACSSRYNDGYDDDYDYDD